MEELQERLLPAATQHQRNSLRDRQSLLTVTPPQEGHCLNCMLAERIASNPSIALSLLPCYVSNPKTWVQTALGSNIRETIRRQVREEAKDIIGSFPILPRNFMGPLFLRLRCYLQNYLVH